MFQIVHQMRTRIMTSPAFTAERILAAILFENTADREVERRPTADYLWNVKRIVPFLKVDKGLAAEKSGVQLMRPIPELAALLDKARAKRIFGTKMRSLVKQANGAGIKDIVTQQFELARQIIAADLVPIVEPEVDIHCPEKARAEELLKAAILDEVDRLPADHLVMLKLTLPEKDDLYADFVKHPRVVRVVALSGGYSRDEAQRALAKEPRRRGELFAGVGRGALGAAVRCRVQRADGRLHPEHLRGLHHLSGDVERTEADVQPPRSPPRRRGRPSPRAVASSKGDDSIPARRIRRHQTLVLSDREAAGTDYVGASKWPPCPRRSEAARRPGPRFVHRRRVTTTLSVSAEKRPCTLLRDMARVPRGPWHGPGAAAPVHSSPGTRERCTLPPWNGPRCHAESAPAAGARATLRWRSGVAGAYLAGQEPMLRRGCQGPAEDGSNGQAR